MNAGVFLSCSVAALAIMAYVTDDTPAEIETSGYFDNADKYLPEVTVVQILSAPTAAKAEAFTAILTRTAKKATAKSPRDFTYKLTRVVDPAVAALQKRIAALESSQTVAATATKTTSKDPVKAISADPSTEGIGDKTA